MKGQKAIECALKSSIEDQFFGIKPEKQDTWGKKYFRYNHLNEQMVEVVLMPRFETKRGRHSAIGIFTVGRLSFLSDYLAIGKVEHITKDEYEARFREVVNILA